MSKWKLIVAAAIWLSPASSAVVPAQTQAAMNAAACDAYTKADADMNAIYGRIMRERKSDPPLIRKMRIAQRAWVAYRDAHLASLYPAADPQREYGSTYAACRCTTLAEATKKRTEELRRWAEGAAEGDVCAGSIKMQSGDGGGMSTDVPEYERLDSVFRKRWTLTQVGERSIAADAPYLEFNVKQGRFSGSGGCNRIFGGYSVDKTELRVTPIGGTKRACAGAAAQQVETDFIRALGRTTRFDVQGDVIRLFAANSLLLVFRAGATNAGGDVPSGASGQTSGQTSGQASVTGTVSYRQRIALTPDAVIEVKLVDVSRADAPSITIAEQRIRVDGRQVPIAFALRYQASRIDSRYRYAVQARILEGGSARFITTQAYPVITSGNPVNINVIVSPVG